MSISAHVNFGPLLIRPINYVKPDFNAKRDNLFYYIIEIQNGYSNIEKKSENRKNLQTIKG